MRKRDKVIVEDQFLSSLSLTNVVKNYDNNYSDVSICNWRSCILTSLSLYGCVFVSVTSHI